MYRREVGAGQRGKPVLITVLWPPPAGMVLHLLLALLLLVLAVRRCRLRGGAGRGGGGLADMPGPAPWPLLGTLPWYWTGRYSWDRLHTTGLAKYNQFGPAVREQVPPPAAAPLYLSCPGGARR